MKVLYTTAQIPLKYENRKNDYIEGYSSLNKIVDKKDIYIIESFLNEPGFLKELDNQVFVSNKHDSNIKNKGVLEIMCLKEFFNQTQIEEEELVCKVTGRYSFIDDYFFNKIIYFNNFDFYGKLIDNNIQIFAGCFCMKKKYFTKFINDVNLVNMEASLVNIELEILNFIKKENLKCLFIDKINMKAPIFGTGNIQTIYL